MKSLRAILTLLFRPSFPLFKIIAYSVVTIMIGHVLVNFPINLEFSIISSPGKLFVELLCIKCKRFNYDIACIDIIQTDSEAAFETILITRPI